MSCSRPSHTIALITAVLAVLAAWLLPHARVHAADAVSADTAAMTAQKPLPFAIVDALNKLSGGPHAGYRANHAKGVLVNDTFTPAPGAKVLSKSVLFNKTVPATIRFSNATGLPTMPDADGGGSAARAISR